MKIIVTIFILSFLIIKAVFSQQGSLDMSLGGDGKVITDVNPNTSDEIDAIAIQDDGKILATGLVKNPDNSNFNFNLVRYNTDGSPDEAVREGRVIYERTI